MACIVLFTDFGQDGPYVGQIRVAVEAMAPGTLVIDLMHDAPRFDPRASSYLLAALVQKFPWNAICVGVVDPGVGSDRAGVVLAADGRFFVGPENGLFEMIRRRAKTNRLWVLPKDQKASPTFHGRDIFAPAAAHLANGRAPEDIGARPAQIGELVLPSWPDDLPEIIYFDHYGNAMTGLRAEGSHQKRHVEGGGNQGRSRVPLGADVRGRRTRQAVLVRKFERSRRDRREQGSARDELGLERGMAVEVL